MKFIKPRYLIVSGLLASAALLLVECNQTRSTDTSALEELRQENTALKTELVNERKRFNRLRFQLEDAPIGGTRSAPSARGILEELQKIEMTDSNRWAVQRRINFLLESLAREGEGAVPHIRKFLNLMEDVEFAPQSSDNRRAGFSVKLDFDHPPSLRIGLVDVLKEIGGDLAESVLAEVMEVTGHGFEVAYVAKTVRSMIGEDAYRDEALAAAHDLLINPIEIENPNEFDKASKDYLVMVLEMYEDLTFVERSQDILLRPDGTMNRSVFNYLERKEEALDVISQTYHSGEVSSIGDYFGLALAATRFTGKNPHADKIFEDVMIGDTFDQAMVGFRPDNPLSGSIPKSFRTFLLTTMTIGDDPDILQGRVNLINKFHFDEEEAVGQAADLLVEILEYKIRGEDPPDDKYARLREMEVLTNSPQYRYKKPTLDNRRHVPTP